MGGLEEREENGAVMFPCPRPKEVLFEAEPLALVQGEDIRDPWSNGEGT